MKIVIAGDFSPKFGLQEIIRRRDFDYVFNSVIPYIRKADFSIVNFETTVVSENTIPSKKNGPSLSTTADSVDALLYAGFNVVTLANNHFYDFGMNGVETTLSLLDNVGIHHVGAGKNSEEARKILYLRSNNECLAIINCCEHEFSIATKEHGGCNPLNPIEQYYAIREARDKADYVLVIVHGGHELYQLPSTRMQDTYRFFIDAGADAVINHHQHCFSGMEVYNGKPIFYGLGNFLFDTRIEAYADVWHDGYMVILNLENNKIEYDIVPYHQCDNEMNVKILNEKTEIDAFKTKFDELSSIIQNHNQLVRCQTNFYSEQSKGRLSAFEPWRSKILRVAYSRGFLPSLVKGKTAAWMLNYVDCESHSDILKFALRKRMEA